MRPAPSSLRALSVVAAIAARGAVADEPAQAARLRDEIIGSWKPVSARYGGREFRFPEGTTMVLTAELGQLGDKDRSVIRYFVLELAILTVLAVALATSLHLLRRGSPATAPRRE